MTWSGFVPLAGLNSSVLPLVQVLVAALESCGLLAHHLEFLVTCVQGFHLSGLEPVLPDCKFRTS